MQYRMNGIMTKITLIIGSVAVFSMIISTYFFIFSEGELIAQQRGTISIDRAVALPLTTADGNQVKVVVNYNIEDESLIGQRINAVMGIYDRNNGSLIRAIILSKWLLRKQYRRNNTTSNLSDRPSYTEYISNCNTYEC